MPHHTCEKGAPVTTSILQFTDSSKGGAQVSKDMGTLAEAGINSFKFFMAYKGILQVSDEQLLHGFLRCKELGALPQVPMSVPPSLHHNFSTGLTYILAAGS